MPLAVGSVRLPLRSETGGGGPGPSWWKSCPDFQHQQVNKRQGRPEHPWHVSRGAISWLLLLAGGLPNGGRGRSWPWTQLVNGSAQGGWGAPPRPGSASLLSFLPHRMLGRGKWAPAPAVVDMVRGGPPVMKPTRQGSLCLQRG